MTERRILKRFTTADRTGREYVAVSYLETSAVYSISEQLGTTENIGYMLESGELLKKVGEDKFEIVASGQRLRKV